MLNNRQIKVAELASECGISNGSVYTIIHEHLGMSKVSTRWVPRNLNMQDRQQRVESSQELLEVYNANPEDFHTRLVTGDETWLHHWDPDSKKESMQWKHPGSSPPKKFRTQPSASKVMATVFWDSKGIILIDYKPAGTSITGEYYASVIKQLRPASVAQLDAPSDWRPGGRGFNPRRGRQHSFVEIDHEIFSMVILSLPLIQEGQLSVSGERMCTIH